MAEEDKDAGNSENAESAEGKNGEEESLEPANAGNAGNKKMMIIAAVGGLLLLGGGVGAGLFFGGFFDKKPVVSEGEETAEAGSVDHAEAPTEQTDAHGNKITASDRPVFLPLGDILVNLSSSGKRPNFLKIKVSLELANEKDKESLQALKPRIIDNFQVYLRELRIEDLRGSAGLYRLREELLLRVTEAAHPIRIRDVLFQEMLVQ